MCSYTDLQSLTKRAQAGLVRLLSGRKTQLEAGRGYSAAAGDTLQTAMKERPSSAGPSAKIYIA